MASFSSYGVPLKHTSWILCSISTVEVYLHKFGVFIWNYFKGKGIECYWSFMNVRNIYRKWSLRLISYIFWYVTPHSLQKCTDISKYPAASIVKVSIFLSDYTASDLGIRQPLCQRCFVTVYRSTGQWQFQIKTSKQVPRDVSNKLYVLGILLDHKRFWLLIPVCTVYYLLKKQKKWLLSVLIYMYKSWNWLKIRQSNDMLQPECIKLIANQSLNLFCVILQLNNKLIPVSVLEQYF
jgi:hypothetical protein